MEYSFFHIYYYTIYLPIQVMYLIIQFSQIQHIKEVNVSGNTSVPRVIQVFSGQIFLRITLATM